MEFDDLVKHLLEENWKKGTSKAPKGKSFDMQRGGAPSNVDAARDGSGGRYRRTRPPSAPSKKTHGEMEESPEEDAEYRGRKVKLNKPTRGDVKKFKVYVKDPKTGNVKTITYGDSQGGLKGNWNSAEARKSFASRHQCAKKKDRTKAGYWACRAHKDFGKNVPGRFW